jgi:dTDP-4-dehydrorhamnose reductase
MLARNCKILVTGAAGQLGQSLKEEAAHFPNFEMIYVTRAEMDLRDPHSMRASIKKYAPTFIVNAGAYTAVDAAESYSEVAFEVNATGVGTLAAICKEQDIALIHISTDYVFDGESDVAYLEMDATNPQTVYGESKLAGEARVIKASLNRFAIIRTSWVYSVYGHNFLKTMLRLGKDRDVLRVVNDQYGVPTLANDLAKAIFCMLPQLEKSNSGVYHFSNSGSTTWFGFAQSIFRQTNNSVLIHPVATTAYPTPAKRPKFSVLNTDKMRDTFGVLTPDWRDSLQSILSIVDC